jgi:hypothetical protein
MSSAPKGRRRASDRYLTPDPLARFLVGLTPELAKADRVLEPSCGDGAFLDAIRGAGLLDLELVGVDLELGPRARRGGEAGDWIAKVADGLERPEGPDIAGDGYDVVIGNPPYSLAEAFVRRSLARVRLGGVVAFLLRLSFLESRARVPLWTASCDPLDRVHVLAERPSFTEDGRTDSAAYAWFVWRRGRRLNADRWAQLEVVSWKGAA